MGAFRPAQAIEPPEEGETYNEDIGPAAEFATVKARLRKLPFKWRSGGGVLYGRRRPYAAAGEVLFYLGLMLILVAGLARIAGRRDEIFVFEGYGAALPPHYGRTLEVHADRIDASFDANTGDTLSYRTTVRVLDSGKEKARGEVEANSPLRCCGINIYQTRAGTAPTKGLLLEVVKIKEGASGEDYGRATFGWKVGNESGRFTMAPGEEAELGETGLRFRYVDYLEKFFADEEGLTDDGPTYNPAAFINVVNARGETAIGFLYKLTPEKSFVRTDTPDFDPRAAEFNYVEDGGPWRADRREYLFASGSYLALGGDAIKITMGAGEGADIRTRSLEGEMAGNGKSTAARYEFPFGERVSVETGGGEYLLRFVGTRSGRVTGFTVTRDPGLVWFYLGCVLLTAGAFAVAFLRYEELFVYVREGRVYLAGRSRPRVGIARDDFDSWLEYAKGD